MKQTDSPDEGAAIRAARRDAEAILANPGGGYFSMWALQCAAEMTAKANGFCEHTPSIPAQLCLIHSEVSEALEDFRNGDMKTSVNETTNKPEGFPSECADIVIRVMDMCKRLGIDLELEIVKKMKYNLTREWRHGGKAV